MGEPTNLSLYTRVSRRAAAVIISEYSSSFGMAANLLSPRYRGGVRDIYGLVRVADEIVDGAAEQAGLTRDQQQAVLDGLEADTESAIETGYSANIIVHAFARCARDAGIGTQLTRPFFASMRRDLHPGDFTDDELREYIYGSAEVVGLMCLALFLRDQSLSDEERQRLENGARHLGSAFQKINFLRDLAVDYAQLGRRYFPGIDPENVTEAEKDALVTDIEQDLAVAAATIEALPAGCRRAVRAAYLLFAGLTLKLRETPAALLVSSRVRVTTPAKLRLVARAMMGPTT